jgi:hypothetical protein
MRARLPWRPLAGAILLAGLAAGCRPSGPPRIETADDLTGALQDLGMTTLDVGEAAADGFGVVGRRIQIGSAEIEAYQYESVEAREAISSTIPPEATSIGGFPAAWADRPHLWTAGRLIVVYVGTDGGTVLLLSSLMGDSITESEQAGEAPYPPAVTAAIHALAEELSLDPGTIEVLDYEMVDWPDACLGLASEGEECAQAVTPGWQIHLRAGGAEYESHTDALGTEVRH